MFLVRGIIICVACTSNNIVDINIQALECTGSCHEKNNLRVILPLLTIHTNKANIILDSTF